ncbi:MAG: hypothetical protein M3O82_02115, partial [Verrucomicrobiota bacterium]|nr:hypothetical protein [Verrucomicrobiota bacterium]
LLKISSDQNREVFTNQLDDFITMTAATGRVADEREAVTVVLTRVPNTRCKCRYVAVRTAHNRKPADVSPVVKPRIHIRSVAFRNRRER